MIWYQLAALFPVISLTSMVMYAWGARILRLGWVIPVVGILIWITALAVEIDGDIPYWAFIVIGTFSGALGGLIGSILLRAVLRLRFSAWFETWQACRGFSELINIRKGGNREENECAKRRVQLEFLIWASGNPFFRKGFKPSRDTLDRAERTLAALRPDSPTVGNNAWVRVSGKYIIHKVKANAELEMLLLKDTHWAFKTIDSGEWRPSGPTREMAEEMQSIFRSPNP